MMLDAEISAQARAQISPDAFAYFGHKGVVYEYLQRPDGLWGWRTVIGKEWCQPLSESDNETHDQ